MTAVLSFAATPVFAFMALVNAFLGGGADMMCGSEAVSLSGGMTTMYALMSVFHSTPWLKLIARRRSSMKGAET